MGQIVAIATNQIVMMFLLMGVGHLLYRGHFLTDAGVSQMSDLVLFVANPVLIAKALMRALGQPFGRCMARHRHL